MEAIREQYGLTALRLGYSRDSRGWTAGQPAVTCSVRDAGTATDDWGIPAEGIGLLAGGTAPDAAIPDGMQACRDHLQRNPSVADLQAQHAPLWLAVTTEHPLLPGVDWEGGLDELGLPILRLPGLVNTAPTTTPPRPRIALCVSMPRAKIGFDAVDLVTAALDAISPAPGSASGPEVHVFADTDLFHDLTRAASDRAVVHDPRTEGPHRPAARSSVALGTGTDDQPWLAWIMREMDARIDVLHLAGHGYLSGGQGAFAVAEAPDRNYDTSTARFIWPQQITALMTAAGAWGLVVSAAPLNFSASGLRLLSSQVAAHCSIASAFHDPGPDHPVTGLSSVYQLLLHHPAPPPASTRGLSLIMHPGRFGLTVPSTSSYQPAPTSLGEWVDNGEDLPAWMVGARRQVAQWESQLSFDSDAGQATSTRAGLEVAKSRLDAIMREARGSGGTA